MGKMVVLMGKQYGREDRLLANLLPLVIFARSLRIYHTFQQMNTANAFIEGNILQKRTGWTAGQTRRRSFVRSQVIFFHDPAFFSLPH